MKKLFLVGLSLLAVSSAYAGGITYTVANTSSNDVYVSPYGTKGSVTPSNNSYNLVKSTGELQVKFGDSSAQKYISILNAGNAGASGCIVYRYSNMNDIFPINSGTCANVKFSNNTITVSGPVK
ncbi:MAG: hypothetical protein GY821_02775 [Gammaproteobacteria bacterium]|nr:hypothetical protein [Gammaproteobacteria bacterium]